MNETFRVRTLFNCDYIEIDKGNYDNDPLWVQTLYGCRMLIVLRDMYKFNMIYDIPNAKFLTEERRGFSIYPQLNSSIDIYAKPIGLTTQALEVASPIQNLFYWRYGFILRRPYKSVLRRFYSLPFTRPLWDYLYLMIILASFIFFFVSRWERRMWGGYSNYHYELLLAVGACCQRILPLQANTYSRRIAYLSFITFTFILHSFYTSNLLSHLVSDKDNSMNLAMLANSNYKTAKLANLFIPVEQTFYKTSQNTNVSIIQHKLSLAEYLNVTDGLRAIMTSKTALLCDYSAVYPVLTRMFDTETICQLIEIDLYSNIKKYLYTSKYFPYKEQFKIGILRAKESGIYQRLLQDDRPPVNCAHTYPMFAEFQQIIIPFSIFIGSCVVSSFIMLLERWHHRRQVWPYTE